MSIFSLFGKDKQFENPLVVDIHSHLIFDVDDGATSLQNSIELITQFSENGFSKIYTTPHIMGDFYKNSKDNLFPKRDEIRKELQSQDINIQFECAAEYYLDEFFVKKIKEKEDLLTIGKKYILFETSFMNKPNQLFEVIFDLLSIGYKPVLAHPERYLYLHDSFEKYHELKEKGLLFQLNINSLSGYYSKPVKKVAEKLIDAQLIDFVGSDCHNEKHFNHLKNSWNEKYYKKATETNLLNNSLL